MYLYFDKNGTLLETINDEAFRQYNTGVNTVNVFVEEGGDIVAMKYWFKLGNGKLLQKSSYVTDKQEMKAVPFDRNRDLKHFSYGKKYRFFVIDIPSGDITAEKASDDCVAYVSEGNVFSQSGLVLMTIQALYTKDQDESIPALSLDKVAFMVEDAVNLPTSPVDGSEFNWLLNHYVVDNYFRPQLTYNSVLAYQEQVELPISEVDEEGNQLAFNRTPLENESFMAVYTYNGASYLGIGTVVELKTTLVEEDGAESEAISSAVVEFDSKNRLKIGNKQGDDGATFTPSVSKDGIISWTNNGGLENPEPVDITGPVGPQGVGIQSVEQTGTATTDNGTNTLKITLTDGTVAYFRVQNGSRGAKGETGATPSITVRASVDNNYGTPSVSVSKSGTAENPSFSLAFKNLKGNGIKSVTQTSTGAYDGSQNTIRVTLDSGAISNFYVRNGHRGYVFTPSISEDGVLTWTNDGGLTNPEALKIKGDMGLQYNTIFETENPEDISGDVLELPLTGFNRTPIVDEAFLLFSWITSEEQLNIAEFTVQSISDEKAVCLINADTLRQINGSDGVGITEIIGGDAEVTRGETITPITIKTSDGEERQVEIVATNGTTNVVAYTMSVEPTEWKASTEYADLGYNFYATISIGADKLDYTYDTYIPTVTPTDISDILGDNLAPFAVSGASADSGALGVYVYAKEQPTTTKAFNVVLSHVIE